MIDIYDMNETVFNEMLDKIEEITDWEIGHKVLLIVNDAIKKSNKKHLEDIKKEGSETNGEEAFL